MPLTQQVDPARRRLWTRAEGTLTVTDLLGHLEATARGRTLDYDEIVDCSGATTTLTAVDIERLMDERTRLATPERRGATALVASDDVLFGMLRMYAIRTEQVRPIQVFRTLAEAIRWLDAEGVPKLA